MIVSPATAVTAAPTASWIGISTAPSTTTEPSAIALAATSERSERTATMA
jgi:hypothetical protein